MSDKAIPSKYNVHRRDRLKALKLFLLMVVVFILVFRFVIGVSWVSGVSMNPTYVTGEMVIYNRLDKNFSVNDVVSIKMPSGDYYIKRIVAVEGDIVNLVDGTVFINNKEENCVYAEGRTDPQEDTVEYPLTVDEGKVFVLGDNRAESIDSRTYGQISTSQIRGTIIFSFRMPQNG